MVPRSRNKFNNTLLSLYLPSCNCNYSRLFTLSFYYRTVMEALKNLFPIQSTSTLQSKDATTATASYNGPCNLQSQFNAQTARLQQTYKAQRLRNTTRAYEPKQKE
ncbi:hypothetical protein K469DRAFT_188224 [Zopfia rhizophila CBS 207.26]|uniref:Uncharacterized protein n=1 Tax=Zopfia rhizophila CBS 207.26 TaxID=1314779 RepID=A0A6A6EP41_9PEZI|nr:hypothetical protein K469DRAFT_188224 [Zopfia rhizophila CBS 207.26]